jgi:hypothetical protein
VVLMPDYSMESHARDHNNYVNVSRTRKRRAKALLGECMRKENDLVLFISFSFM